MSRLKILFLYPNGKGMAMLPPGISLLSAVLKREGFIVDLFDTTQYDSIKEDGVKESIDHTKVIENKLQVRPTSKHEKVVVKYTDVFEDFRKKVLSFGPDLIAMSTTENMFNLGIALLKKIKDLKILLVYPNLPLMLIPPLNIAIFINFFKKAGYKVEKIKFNYERNI